MRHLSTPMFASSASRARVLRSRHRACSPSPCLFLSAPALPALLCLALLPSVLLCSWRDPIGRPVTAAFENNTQQRHTARHTQEGRRQRHRNGGWSAGHTRKQKLGPLGGCSTTASAPNCRQGLATHFRPLPVRAPRGPPITAAAVENREPAWRTRWCMRFSRCVLTPVRCAAPVSVPPRIFPSCACFGYRPSSSAPPPSISTHLRTSCCSVARIPLLIHSHLETRSCVPVIGSLVGTWASCV
jgi:hypothetical protein